jgi:hypothetical protein
MLSVGIRAVLDENPGISALFCRYSSGSPRCVDGEKSRRGLDTFTSANRFPGNRSEVVELTFPGGVTLPRSTECGPEPHGPWRALLDSRRQERHEIWTPGPTWQLVAALLRNQRRQFSETPPARPVQERLELLQRTT